MKLSTLGIDPEIIVIKWEGPLKINDVLKTKNKAEDCGIYQIYGTHNVFGPDTLLYIGQAPQSFADRISSHEDEWIKWEPVDVNIYLGRLGGYNGVSDKEWDLRITQAEQLIIYFCSPPYNRIKTFNMKESVILLNYGKRHRLPLMYSTLYESEAPKENWKEYGKE
jgi:hypothetical protein